MTRVALFCSNFLPYSQSFVFEELRQHRRYDVEVFTHRRMLADRFPYDRVNVANPLHVVTGRSRLFRRRFASGEFSVVHAHFGPAGTAALPYAERFRLPLLVTFHGYDVPLLRSFERFKPVHWPYALRAPRLLRGMTLGLCASTELRELLLDLGVPADRLVVHRLGVDLADFGPSERDDRGLRVMMIGRFVEKKGFEYGIRAFAGAAARVGDGLELTIVGSGEREAKLRDLVKTLKVADRVAFAGVLTRAEIAAQLGRSDVLLAPSVVGANGNRESGLMVVKEASASQVVPIGTYHGGIPEIIDHESTGFLVPERDVTAMTQHLVTLSRDPELRRRMGAAGRLKMEREYDNRERVAELEDRYDEARQRAAREA